MLLASSTENLKDLYFEQGEKVSAQIVAALNVFANMFGLKPLSEYSPEYIELLETSIVTNHGTLTGKELLIAFDMYANQKLTINFDMRYVKEIQLNIVSSILGAYKTYKNKTIQDIKEKVLIAEKSSNEAIEQKIEEEKDSVIRTICKLYKIYLNDPDSYAPDLLVMLPKFYYWLEKIRLIEIENEKKLEIKGKCEQSLKISYRKRHGNHYAKYVGNDKYKSELKCRMISRAMPLVYENWIAEGIDLETLKHILESNKDSIDVEL